MFCVNGDRFVVDDYSESRFDNYPIILESSENQFCIACDNYRIGRHCDSEIECEISDIFMQLRVTLSRMKFPTNAMHVRYIHDNANVIVELCDVSVIDNNLSSFRLNCKAIVKSGEIFFVEYRPKYPYYRATFEIEADLELLSDDGAVVKTIPLHITDGRLEYGYPVGQ